MQPRAAVFLQLKASQGLCETLIRTAGSPSPSNVALVAGLKTPNPACTLVNFARSARAGDIELKFQRASLSDDSFGSFGCHAEHSTTKKHDKFLPIVFGNPSSVLREVDIAT